MNWFITWTNDDGKRNAEHFFSIEAMWKWLQEYRNNVGGYPLHLCVFKAECIFDGS